MRNNNLVSRGELSALLDAHRVESKGSGSNRMWRCVDPSHDDTHPSMSMFTHRDGSARLRCHACGWFGGRDDLLRLWGEKTEDDTWRDETRQRNTNGDVNGRVVFSSGQNVDPVRSEFGQSVSGPDGLGQVGTDGDSAGAGLVERAGGLGQSGVSGLTGAAAYWAARGVPADVVAELGLDVPSDGPHVGRAWIPFRDADGTEIGGTSRTIDGTGPRWKDGGPKVLFWAGSSRSAQAVVLTEGPSDAIAVYGLGVPAVAVLGAHAFKPEWCAELVGYRVLVCGDADGPGRQFTSDVVAALRAAGVTARAGVDPAVYGAGDLAEIVADGVDREALQSDLLGLLRDGWWPSLRRITSTTQLPTRRWLVPGWLQAEGISLIHGNPGSGKSWIVEYLAVCLSHGRRWFGVDLDPCGAAIFDWENPQPTILDRVRALRVDDEMPFSWFAMEADRHLGNPDVVAEVCDWLEVTRPGFVFLDSLSRSFPGLEENSAPAVNEMWHTVGKIRKACGGMVMVLHHNNKQEVRTHFADRVRGDNAIAAGCDQMWMASGGENNRTLFCTKMRNGVTPERMHWVIVPDQLDPGAVRFVHLPTMGVV